MFKLECAFQNYAWGRDFQDSEVAKMVKEGEHAKALDETKPFAEFWMGVHPNGPSKIKATGSSLSSLLSDDNKLLGAHEQGTLQFLFKVLSVKKALSVQTHPTKEQAKLLHAQDPKNYPDANHKPEMAIALTDFQLLCGFRVPKEIHENLTKTPELLDLLGEKKSLLNDFLTVDSSEQESRLKQIFSHIWSSPQEVLTKHVDDMIRRLNSSGESKTDLEKLLIRLDAEYPGGDVGVFAPLLLNYFTLSPGEATFLGPNRPHAYLLGDCIECMACSDNTIRAGLTPKYKDIKTLCENTQYVMTPPPLFPSKDQSAGTKLYAPPVPEFAVQEVTSSASSLQSSGSSSIIIVVKGSATLTAGDNNLTIQRGDVIFTSAHLHTIDITQASDDLLMFRAYTPK